MRSSVAQPMGSEGHRSAGADAADRPGAETGTCHHRHPMIAGGFALLATLVIGACTAPGPPAGRDTGDTIRVLAYNIHHGEGMDSVLDLERIGDLIRRVDPDLVALQEVDSMVQRTGLVDQAARLGALTGMEHRFGHFMPYQGGAYGMAILSRLPILSTENLRLPDGAEPRSALAVRVELPRTGTPLTFTGIHFYRTEEERLAQATRLEALLDGRTGPVILAGDFNSQPGSPVMDHLRQGWHVVDKGDDRNTYPSFAPAREIDFLLLRPRERFEVLSEALLDEPVISDHRPMVVELVVGK